MLHDHKRDSRPRRQMAQQFHCRFESASRTPDSNDRTQRLCCFLSISRIGLGIPNCGGTSLFLLRLRDRTLTFHSRGHFSNNDLEHVRIQACDSLVRGGAVACGRCQRLVSSLSFAAAPGMEAAFAIIMPSSKWMLRYTSPAKLRLLIGLQRETEIVN